MMDRTITRQRLKPIQKMDSTITRLKTKKNLNESKWYMESLLQMVKYGNNMQNSKNVNSYFGKYLINAIL